MNNADFDTRATSPRPAHPPQRRPKAPQLQRIDGQITPGHSPFRRAAPHCQPVRRTCFDRLAGIPTTQAVIRFADLSTHVCVALRGARCVARPHGDPGAGAPNPDLAAKAQKPRRGPSRRGVPSPDSGRPQGMDQRTEPLVRASLPSARRSAPACCHGKAVVRQVRGREPSWRRWRPILGRAWAARGSVIWPRRQVMV